MDSRHLRRIAGWARPVWEWLGTLDEVRGRAEIAALILGVVAAAALIVAGLVIAVIGSTGAALVALGVAVLLGTAFAMHRFTRDARQERAALKATATEAAIPAHIDGTDRTAHASSPIHETRLGRPVGSLYRVGIDTIVPGADEAPSREMQLTKPTPRLEPTDAEVEELARFNLAAFRDQTENILGSPSPMYGIRMARIHARQELRQKLAKAAQAEADDSSNPAISSADHT